jgi:uncharacterized metal-binding protein YceD (DUF177 family)
MADLCVIPIEHVKEGKSVALDHIYDPVSLDLGDKDLTFDSAITLKGTAYLAEDHLVLQLNISGAAFLPCLVCNKPVKIPFNHKNLYITKPLTDVHAGRFDFKDELREAILLEFPSFAECEEGSCPERTSIECYLKHPSPSETSKKDEKYFPFHALEDHMKKN